MLNISEGMLKNVVELLVSKLPDTTLEQVAFVVKSGVELKAQLDRIEARQAAIEMALGFIAGALREQGVLQDDKRGIAAGSRTNGPAADSS